MLEGGRTLGHHLAPSLHLEAMGETYRSCIGGRQQSPDHEGALGGSAWPRLLKRQRDRTLDCTTGWGRPTLFLPSAPTMPLHPRSEVEPCHSTASQRGLYHSVLPTGLEPFYPSPLRPPSPSPLAGSDRTISPRAPLTVSSGSIRILNVCCCSVFRVIVTAMAAAAGPG